jgi:selenocysteine-specific elongation factor
MTGEHIVPADHAGALPAADQELLDTLLRELAAGEYQPPDWAGLRCRTTRNEKRLRELIGLAVDRGLAVRLADGLWLHGERWTALVEGVTARLGGGEKLTVADIRTMLNSSRKFVVPIVERLDAAGITRRQGDFRVLGPKAPGREAG